MSLLSWLRMGPLLLGIWNGIHPEAVSNFVAGEVQLAAKHGFQDRFDLLHRFESQMGGCAGRLCSEKDVFDVFWLVGAVQILPDKTAVISDDGMGEEIVGGQFVTARKGADKPPIAGDVESGHAERVTNGIVFNREGLTLMAAGTFLSPGGEINHPGFVAAVHCEDEGMGFVRSEVLAKGLFEKLFET